MADHEHSTPVPPTPQIQHQLEIPELNNGNYIPWKITVEHFARAQGVYDHLTNNIPVPSDPIMATEHFTKHTQAQLLVLSTLSHDIMKHYTDSELHGPISVLYNKIHHRMTTVSPEKSPENLRRKARSIHWSHSTPISNFINQHLELRTVMIRSNYPEISNEQTTIRFMLEALEGHSEWTTFLQTVSAHMDLNPDRPPSLHHITAMMLKHDDIRSCSSISNQPNNHSTPPPFIRNPQRYYQRRSSTRRTPKPHPFHPENHIPRPHGHSGRWCTMHGTSSHDTSHCKMRKRLERLPHTSDHKQFRRTPPQNIGHQAIDPSEGYDYPAPHSDSDDVSSSQHTTYILDSGANRTHITSPSTDIPVKLSSTICADGRRAQVTHGGRASIPALQHTPLPAHDVVVAPSLQHNLLSVGQIAKTHDVIFQRKTAFIKTPSPPPPSDQIVATASKTPEGLYRLRYPNPHKSQLRRLRRNNRQKTLANGARELPTIRKSKQIKLSSTNKPPAQTPHIIPKHLRKSRSQKRSQPITFLKKVISKKPQSQKPRIPPRTHPRLKADLPSTIRDYHKWHLKLNHIHPNKIHYMAKNGLVSNMPSTLLRTPPRDFICSGCAQGKMHAAPFRRKVRLAPIGSHLHTDVCGPMPHNSFSRNRFFITFLDEGSRFLTLIPIKSKADVGSTLSQHITDTLTHTPHRITQLTSDNAKEYHTHSLTSFYKQHNIHLHPTIPHTPQENSLAERVNRTIMNTTRTTLLSANLPLELWDYAAIAAADTYNHTPHAAHGQLPAALWHNIHPQVDSLLPFGTDGYIYDPSPHNKLQSRSKLVTYIGRCDYNHYFVYDRDSHKISRCRTRDFTIYDPLHDPICTTSPSSMTLTAKTPSLTFTEPKNVKQARSAPDAREWEIAWNAELDNLEDRGVLTYIPKTDVPPNTKLLPVQTVIKLKTDSDGSPTTRKVRCTIRGDRQISGLHYDPDDLSSPVASREAIRTALALAAAHNWHTFNWDLEAAFLHELFTEDRHIFLHQPRRFDGTLKYPNHVAKLTGNMYGSRQACKIFTEGLADFLNVSDFSRLTSDTCSFLLRHQINPSHFVLLVITVDDFLVVSNHIPLVNKVKTRLQQKYTLKDLGQVTNILGWKVEHSKEGIKISQPGYIQNLIDRFGQTDAKPFPSPIASELVADLNSESKPLDTSTYEYKSLIGSLRYLCDSTRPDLSYIVGFLGRYSHAPTQHHWKAAIRILRHLKTSSSKGILYPRGFSTGLQAYSDSDFAACPDTRRSTSGSIIFYNSAPISWQSRRQRNVVTSTHAAEYIAAFQTTLLLKSISNFLTELGHAQTDPIPLYMDNAAAISTAKAKYPTPTSRHIDVKFHWLREQVKQKFILPTHIPSAQNPADLLTKALKPAQFTAKVQLLRLNPLTARGD